MADWATGRCVCVVVVGGGGQMSLLVLMDGFPRSTADFTDTLSSKPTQDINMTDPNTSIYFISDFDELYNEINYTDPFNGSDFMLDVNTLICESTPISHAVNLVVCSFYILIFLLAIPGNLLVGLVIGLSKQALSPSDLYLLHLAVADVILAATLPFWATSVLQGWLFGSIGCKMVCLLLEVSFYASILFLACISVDRYLVIVRGVESRSASHRLLGWGACGGVWVLGTALSLPALYNSSFTPLDGGQEVCAERHDSSTATAWLLATRGLRHTLGFLLPLAIMLVCYGVTVLRLLRTRGGFQRQRAMRVIVAVVVAFLLCWSPYHLAVMADTLLRAKLLPEGCTLRTAVSRAMFTTQSLGLLHSCVNPVLYAFVGKKFRQRLAKELRRRGVLERTSVSRSSRSSSMPENTSTLM
ncbi:C-X-C chemokine receptor type 1-like [Hypomesus transpacificus]|uniref:C-X-C chemokine receptor type 1-like n=1 Tax=Hypomesus transpacificus TaxID=137520 RepID=UPI001F07BD2B|nr:C-X-C chemokine receptor type 1-like [Hypomesus transpacificus]